MLLRRRRADRSDQNGASVSLWSQRGIAEITKLNLIRNQSAMCRSLLAVWVGYDVGVRATASDRLACAVALAITPATMTVVGSAAGSWFCFAGAGDVSVVRGGTWRE